MEENGGMREELRSLERQRMYEIFAPLDPEERLPRELLIEQRRFRSVGRRELAGMLWLPALLVAMIGAGWVTGNASIVIGAVLATLGALCVFAITGKR